MQLILFFLMLLIMLNTKTPKGEFVQHKNVQSLDFALEQAKIEFNNLFTDIESLYEK